MTDTISNTNTASNTNAASNTAEQLTSSLWRLPLPVKTLPPYDHTNSYILLDVANKLDPATPAAVTPAAVSGALVVDVGSVEAADALIAWFEEHHCTLQGVLLTHSHSDHVAGLAHLLEHHFVPVYLHPLEHDRLRQQLPHYRAKEWDVQRLEDGNTLEHGSLQVSTLHTPGHSRGHLSFVVRQAGQPTVMVAGDMVTGAGAIWVGTPEGDVSAYLQSLTRLSAVDADCLAPSHGAVSWQPQVLIDNARVHKQAREQQVLEVLESPASLTDITNQLYAHVPNNMRDFAERSLQAHLNKLLHEKRIKALLAPDLVPDLVPDDMHNAQRPVLYQRHKL